MVKITHTRGHTRLHKAKTAMKETDLNYLELKVREFLADHVVAIREVLINTDIVNWFVTVYSTIDRVKEVTTRYNHGVYGDVTLIATQNRVTIIDNATESMSWVKVPDSLVMYEELTADLYNMLVYLDAAYIRLIHRV